MFHLQSAWQKSISTGPQSRMLSPYAIPLKNLKGRKKRKELCTRRSRKERNYEKQRPNKDICFKTRTAKRMEPSR